MWDIKVYSRRNFIAKVLKAPSRGITKGVLAISITDPWEEPVNLSMGPYVRGLSLQFEDTECWAGISKEDAKRIAEFILDNKDYYTKIAVHCEAGISRSAGVAAAIMKYLTGSDEGIFNSKRYCPNMRCYRYVLDALYAAEEERSKE